MKLIGQAFVAVLVMVAIVSWERDRGLQFLKRWADENGYQIVKSKWSPFGGPFWWTIINKQRTFHVCVRDSSGATRSGWVLCGSWLMGKFDGDAQVKWGSQ